VSSGRRISIALVALVLLAVGGWLVRDLSGASTSPGSSETALSALPPQAAETYALIKSGGPFPYPRDDGIVFDNREHRLPAEPTGYYHEYTVPTPGDRGRGARRLITGAGHQLYYTGDHYAHFVAVDTNK
jgi:guanyl-specific ribonuclease Sa